MPKFSLRDAAQQAGTSKSTILRAIQNGRLSAGRTANGGYEIDPSELSRVYPPKLLPVVPEHSAHHAVGQNAMPELSRSASNVTDATDHELALRMAALEAELKGMRDLLDEVKRSRDQWQDQASRLAITDQRNQVVPRSLWQRLVG